MQLLTPFFWVFHSFFIPQFLVLTRASLLLALLAPSLCPFSLGRRAACVENSSVFLRFWCSIAATIHKVGSCTQSRFKLSLEWFLSNGAAPCSISATEVAAVAAQQVPLSLASSQEVLAHWSLCKHTWARGAFIPSALIVPSPGKLIRFVISLWWLRYPSECFASGRIWTSPHFLLKLPVMTIFLPLFLESVCPYNGSFFI